MDYLSTQLQMYQNGKYAFLRLYNVSLDKDLGICELTFLYPQKYVIDELSRAEIQQFCAEKLELTSKIKVKFKKSFLDPRLLKKFVLDHFENNNKSIFSQISDQQIDVVVKDENVEITVQSSKEIARSIDDQATKSELLNALNKQFIANFEIKTVENSAFAIKDEIPFVPIVAKQTKTPRYEVTIIKKLFGKDIKPFPEQIKNIKSEKQAVILFGKISNVQKKSFVAKKGKQQGQEKFYFTFLLYDGKQIDCVYFCPKSNLSKCKALTDGLTFLCLGDIKEGLSGRLTYYVHSMTFAQMLKKPSEDEPQKQIESFEHKQVAQIEDFSDHEQENLFSKKVSYKEPISTSNIVVYDLETTGLNPEGDEIIEIGAIKIEKGVITKKFSTFVKPTNPIPLEATRKNNITNDMVKNAPKIEDAIVDFYNFCEGCIISGYNNTEFDNKFIRKAAQKVGLSFANQNIDVFLLARMSHLKSKNLKLTSVAAALGIDLKNAHRAYNDAFATAKVLLKLNEI